MSAAKLYVWRHGTLFVDLHESMERAIRSAIAISDYGSGSPHGVEVGEEWVTSDDDRWRAIEREVWAAQDARYAEQPKRTHVLEVQAPDGKWAHYDGFTSFDEARVAANQFERARIRKTGPGPYRAVWSTDKDPGS